MQRPSGRAADSSGAPNPSGWSGAPQSESDGAHVFGDSCSAQPWSAGAGGAPVTPGARAWPAGPGAASTARHRGPGVRGHGPPGGKAVGGGTAGIAGVGPA